MTIWVLGASDPEMEAIERLLSAAGQEIAYAVRDGVRVHAGNAYKADGAVYPHGGRVDFAQYELSAFSYDAVLVECRIDDDIEPTWDSYFIDHHRPGDPGHGRPPARFLDGSSIGQVVRRLVLCNLGVVDERLGWPIIDVNTCNGDGFYFDGSQWSVMLTSYEWIAGKRFPGHYAVLPAEIVLTAAADHCLAAAYRGECPGVDPGVLFDWRVESRAMFQRRPVDSVVADINAAIAALRSAPRVEIAGVEVADLGDSTVPEAPEAAAWTGIPFLATVTERGGRRKQVLQAAPPQVISAWMKAHPGSYGDPARGFAGRYL